MSQEINNSAAISLTYDEFKSQYLEYQSKLDKLRKNGTDRIKVLENENRKIKNNRILADDVKKSLIEKNKAGIEAAKQVAQENKEEIKQIADETVKFVNVNHKPLYQQLKVEAKEEKAKENLRFKEEMAKINDRHKERMLGLEGLKDNKEEYKIKLKLENQTYKQEIFEEKTKHQNHLQKIKDKVHDSFIESQNWNMFARDGK